MGCHTWTYVNKQAYKKHQFDTAPHGFMFRVFNYPPDALTSFEEARDFVLNALKKNLDVGTQISPKEKSLPPVMLTYTGQMRGKILLASEDGRDENLTDPTLTIERVKSFFEKYPEGVIDFG